jgi:glutathione reductase (NADPH)
MADFDLLVIGAGSGGVRAARIAASHGKRVGIVERQFLGGTCVNVGCIPKKLFYYAAHYAEDFHDAVGFGWTVSPPVFSWSTLVNNKNTEIARLNQVYKSLLDKSGATLLEGEGRITSAHSVQVNGVDYSADRILIAVGGKPWLPPIPGIESAISSNEFFSLDALPSSAVVVGGGYIAVELAGILNTLGVNTTIVHRGDGLLRNFDKDIRTFLTAEMVKKGITLQLNKNVSRMERNGQGVQVTLDSGESVTAEQVLYATGRKPALVGLGLENTAVQLKPSGHITVNGNFQTNEPSIYAIGDVVGFKELTPVATAEAMYLVDHWFGSGTKLPLDYSLIPSAVFSQPAIGTVGLTEKQAQEKCGSDDLQIFSSEFRALRHTLTGNTERTLMKLVVQKSTDRVLGIHMAGADAGEIIQGFAVAMQMGVTKAQLDATIGIHPTAAEEFVTMRSPTG